jgi:uncharacterized protein YdhG (YjbR/CyaY superfamily)
MTPKPTTIDQYVATFPDDKQVVLDKLRKTIRAAAPKAEEAISYAMPAFTLDGQTLIWFAGWKHHYSLYPVSPELLRAHGIDPEGYEFSKGTIRFPAAEPLPYDLVKKIVKARIAELKKADRE